MYDINKVREDFPILSRTIHKKPLIYLDNGATTQKPNTVLDAMQRVYTEHNANVHRGVHTLSREATELHEASRLRVARFINAPSEKQIIFTRGTTESINLVATCFGEQFLSSGDEVIISAMEHHANIVPWQMICTRKGAQLRIIELTEQGELNIEHFLGLLNERTKIVAISHVSNVLGTVNPVEEIIKHAHDRDIPVLVDGAQAIAHTKVDVQKLGADFYVFSGHKIYGPTGIGVLYGREDLLEAMPPYMGGGEMIAKVTFEETTYNELPYKYEAGTPDYVATHGLATAVDYLLDLGMDNIQKHEAMLTKYAMEQLSTIKDIRFIGTPRQKDAVVSFLVGDIHPFDFGTLLDRLGIALRTGHHCAQPLMQRLGIQGTVRASFGLYNTKEEIDVLVKGIERVAAMF